MAYEPSKTFGASGTGHGSGTVPDPGSAAGTGRFLREDATWGIPAGGWQTTTVTTGSNGQATWTFPTPFTVAPIVIATAQVPSGGTANNYNVQVVSVSTTAVVLQVNYQGAVVSLVGQTTLSLFTVAPSGVTIHVGARGT